MDSSQYVMSEVDEGSETPASRPTTSGPPPLLESSSRTSKLLLFDVWEFEETTRNTSGYKFSQDELRVMAECNRESFYQRSLPFASLLGLGTFSLVQSGYLRANPRFGAMPKVSLAVVVGYFLGKLSYQQACAEKLMALPGSYIGQLLRERRDGLPGAGRAAAGPAGSRSMLGAGPGDIYSDAGPGSALDLNTDRPSFDNAHPPPSTVPHPSPPPTPKSYEDLRQRNRTDLYKPGDPYREDPSLVPPVRRAPPSPPTGPATPTGPSRRTNQYGDEMD